MKNQMLVDELVGLNIYGVDYSTTCSESDGYVTIVDNDNNYRRVIDNGLSDDDLKLLLSAKQTSYLKSIKTMITFFTILTVIGILFSFYVALR